jgi:anthranilate synthase component II
MTKVLILDNYDSFTYNLAHLVEKVSDHEAIVIRNDAISIEDAGKFEKIILSPGPGLPADAGIMPELIRKWATDRAIFGVCLGFQAIAEWCGCHLRNLGQVYHGTATPVHVDTMDPLFEGCPKSFNVGRYHSWVVDERSVNAQLKITAKDDKGHVMAGRHLHANVCGVQFHPESILSEYGEQIMSNWLQGHKL